MVPERMTLKLDNQDRWKQSLRFQPIATGPREKIDPTPKLDVLAPTLGPAPDWLDGGSSAFGSRDTPFTGRIGSDATALNPDAQDTDGLQLRWQTHQVTGVFGAPNSSVGTSVFNEVVADDCVNCFDMAAQLAAAGVGDRLVFLSDPSNADNNGAGHVLVWNEATQQLWDPTNLDAGPFSSVDDWLAQQTTPYQHQATLPADVMLGLLAEPPGLSRQLHFNNLRLTRPELWDDLLIVGAGEYADERIGRVYQIEGVLNGQRVQYTGSTAQELYQRLGSKHQWNQLLRDPNTVVTEFEVFADPDVDASNRGTQRSATNEALRAAEEPRRQAVQRDGVRELNRIRAATPENVRLWAERHNVTVGEGRVIDRAALRLSAFVDVVGIFAEVFRFNREQYMLENGLVQVPHVFHDQGGTFTVGVRRGPLNGAWGNRYAKAYVDGPREGEVEEITAEDYRFFEREGRLLYGYLDIFNNFQPGLIYREIPTINLDDLDAPTRCLLDPNCA